MPGNKPKVYWDSCAFIAHLNQESNKGEAALRHLKAMLETANDGDLQICTSTITMVEVLGCKMTDEAEADFIKMMSTKFRGMSVIQPGPTIMLKARELREWSKGVVDQLTLSTPDAIHLATAYFAQAQKFYTFDGIAKPDKHDRDKKLLPLDRQMPEGLRILQPYMDNPGMGDLFTNADGS